MPPRVALDTSACLLPVQLDVRLFDELDRLLGDYDLYVPPTVIEELETLAEGRGEEAKAATVGLELATERCADLPVEGATADNALDQAAVKRLVDYIVTTDRALRDRILERDVSVIALRGSNKLALTNP
ncbi:MAG: twitching motility protein PilT [Natrialbaceae archaeon]|nr:twitching motility protein PilT [Natrialbaceae archaeon]